MASTVTTRINLVCASDEDLGAADVEAGSDAAARTLSTGGFGQNKTFTSTSTPSVDLPPMVKKVSFNGTTTIDLTAGELQGGRTQDFTGKKVIGYVMRAASSNTGAFVTVKEGAADGYPIFGATNEYDLEPGECIAMNIDGVASGKAAVSATVKNIQVVMTAADTLDMEIHFGT